MRGKIAPFICFQGPLWKLVYLVEFAKSTFESYFTVTLHSKTQYCKFRNKISIIIVFHLKIRLYKLQETVSPKSAENYYHLIFQVVTRTEKDSYIVAFSDEMVPCPVTTDMTLQQVLMAMNQVRSCFTTFT
jgi:hypothetical protein